jgi:biopolymer transport protein ExbB
VLANEVARADVAEEPEAAAEITLPPDAIPVVVEKMKEASTQWETRLIQRESRYRQRLEQAQSRLSAAHDKLNATEVMGRRLEQRFDDNKVELSEKAQRLKEKIGALKELFGVFQQNASDLIGAFNGSATSIQHPDRDLWLEAFANRMKNASEVTSADDIKTLWFHVLQEIQARGDIVRLQIPVYAEENNSQIREVIRVGGFDLIAGDDQPEYLRWRAGRQQVWAMPRQPSGPFLEQIERYAQGGSELEQLGVDPTGGVLVSLLAAKPTTEERAAQGGLVGYMIIGLGGVACLLALAKLLDIIVISLRVAAQAKANDNPRSSNALGRLILAYRQYQSADSELLEMRLHDRLRKESDRIQRFAIFLTVIAAVAPLMGLLGTVVGMINTFQAITLYGTGDPQTMAGGISQALVTTVLGLVVAVPAVLLNALISAQANNLITNLKQQMTCLMGDQRDWPQPRQQPPGSPPSFVVHNLEESACLST